MESKDWEDGVRFTIPSQHGDWLSNYFPDASISEVFQVSDVDGYDVKAIGEETDVEIAFQVESVVSRSAEKVGKVLMA